MLCSGVASLPVVAVVVGVVGGVPLVGSGVVASMGVGLPLGSAVLGALLVAVLSPEERCEMHTYICNYSAYGPAIFQRVLYASPTVILCTTLGLLHYLLSLCWLAL